LRIDACLLLGEEAVTAPEEDDKKAALLAIFVASDIHVRLHSD
jgi:hypothetical protein